MQTKIILGTFFGDEGKGLVTSSLAQKRDLVVRFNGGSQAGHTVEKDGYRHIFSNFGAGTVNGAHTYWSEYCAFCPKSFFNEGRKLREEGYCPIYNIHPLAPVITPFDISYNRNTELINKHGSVGMGFGATIDRTENTPHKLYAIHLTYPTILESKLREIAKYYNFTYPDEIIEEFMFYCENISFNICNLSEIKNNYKNIVFEGAQGIMLDMDHGFFPNVTRSNTTSKNALKIIKDNNLPTPDIYYVMRSYLTRHGNGYMPNENKNLKFEDKTNVSHAYQGNFRQGYHSLEMLNYALNCDNIYSFNCNKSLVITCLNQTEGKILIDNEEQTVEEFSSKLKIKNIYTSYSKTNINKLEEVYS